MRPAPNDVSDRKAFLCACRRRLGKGCSGVLLLLSVNRPLLPQESPASAGANNPSKSERTARDQDDSRNQPQLNDPAKVQAPAAPGLNSWLKLPSGVKLEVEHRSRYETIANRFRLGEAGGDQQWALRTRVRFEVAERLDPFRFLVEIEDSRAYLTDSGSTVSTSHVDKHDLLQLHADWFTRNFLRPDLNSTLQFGRFSMDLGKRRLFSRLRFRNTTNRFDGVHWNLEASHSWQLHTFLFNPVTLAMEEVDRRDRNTLFWGAYLNARQQHPGKLELYYFGLRTTPPEENRRRRLTTVGLRWYKDAARGQFDHEIETALQFGRQFGTSHFAELAVGEFGYTFNRIWNPRLVFQYLYASGDKDPTDNQTGTFDALFGARRFEFGPTALWGPVFRSNTQGPGCRLVVSPASNFELMLGHRLWWLAQARDQWVGSGLRDPSGSSGSFLGHFFEGWLLWKANSILSFDIGYAFFAKGVYPRQVPRSPSDRNSHYFYVSPTVRF